MVARMKTAGVATSSPQFCGMTDPWNLDKDHLVKVMQYIWNKLYSKAIPYQITAHNSVCAVVRISTLTVPQPIY